VKDPGEVREGAAGGRGGVGAAAVVVVRVVLSQGHWEQTAATVPAGIDPSSSDIQLESHGTCETSLVSQVTLFGSAGTWMLSSLVPVAVIPKQSAWSFDPLRITSKWHSIATPDLNSDLSLSSFCFTTSFVA